ncbi:hypothetical protein BOX15_Mlig005297g2 [Macrostomum lignano]|uniref:Uncharacterized protein n=3 Tax=Macrostomum lignano TaxID=282301 RepID=A0A267EGE6_9PLAT|nr:hypothetical protein BOX15_Mlig005297g2 [Macrostomum lignano]
MKISFLLSILAVAGLFGGTRCATTINFALLWDEPGVASTASNMFKQIFLPDLRNSCLSSPDVNNTVFKFIDAPQKGLFDILLANLQIDQLTKSGCLFAGAFDQAELGLFAQSGIPSGVPGYPSMQIHVMAPLTLTMAVEGVYKALTESLRLPEKGSVDSKLSIILGPGYSIEELQAVVDRYPGYMFFYQLRLGNEDAIVNKLKASGSTNFLLASPAREADFFISAAFNSLLLSSPYRWFLFNVRLVDKNNFAGFKVVSKNITSMEFGPISTAIAYNLSRAREIYIYDMLSIWNVYLKKIVCKQPNDVNESYSGMTGDFRLYPNGSVVRTEWRMHFYGGLGSERQRIGNWSSLGSFHFSRQPNRVLDEATVINELNKNTFRVVTILKPPFVKYKKGFENRNDVPLYDALDGFAIDICKEILKNMSIHDVSFFLQPDNQYGSRDSRGNWNGIVQTLMQGKANFACASLSDTTDRRQVLKFTQPYLNFQLSILYKKRIENPLVFMFQFMRPFHLYTWLAVIGSVVGLSIVLTVLHKLSRNAANFGIYETIFFSFASLIQGITGTPPDRPSGQLVIAIYWLFAFVILVAYVTNYAATRTLNRLQSEITSLSTLYAQSTYDYGTVAGTSYFTLFENTTDNTQQQIYRYMINNQEKSLMPNLTVALELVVNGTYALIYDSALNKYNGQSICNSVNIGAFSLQSASFAMPVSAEYESIIDAQITHLIKNGMRDQLYEKYFNLDPSELPDCRSTTFPDLLHDYIPEEPPFFGTKNGALTLNNTLGIAVINLVGCVMTLFLAIVEFAYLRCKYWQRRRRQRALERQVEINAVPKLTADLEQMESVA